MLVHAIKEKICFYKWFLHETRGAKEQERALCL